MNLGGRLFDLVKWSRGYSGSYVRILCFNFCLTLFTLDRHTEIVVAGFFVVLEWKNGEKKRKKKKEKKTFCLLQNVKLVLGGHRKQETRRIETAMFI